MSPADWIIAAACAAIALILLTYGRITRAAQETPVICYACDNAIKPTAPVMDRWCTCTGDCGKRGCRWATAVWGPKADAELKQLLRKEDGQ